MPHDLYSKKRLITQEMVKTIEKLFGGSTRIAEKNGFYLKIL